MLLKRRDDLHSPFEDVEDFVENLWIKTGQWADDSIMNAACRVFEEDSGPALYHAHAHLLRKVFLNAKRNSRSVPSEEKEALFTAIRDTFESRFDTQAFLSDLFHLSLRLDCDPCNTIPMRSRTHDGVYSEPLIQIISTIKDTSIDIDIPVMKLYELAIGKVSTDNIVIGY